VKPHGSTRRQFLAGAGGIVAAGFLPPLEWAEAAFAEGLPSTPRSIGFNAMHAAPGTYSTFTLGCPGARGGLATSAAASGSTGGWQPANQDVYIGAEGQDGKLRALPFFEPKSGDPSPIALTSVERDYRLSTDDWRAGDVRFRILSSTRAIPEPGKASAVQLRDGLLPAVLASITVDNRRGSKPRQAFFGIGLPPGDALPTAAVPGGTVRALGQISAVKAPAPGFVYDDTQNHLIGVYCSDPGATAAAGPDFASAHSASPGSGQGRVGLLRLAVPAGQRKTFRIAIGFYHGGTVMRGADIEASYWYSKLFSGLEAVAGYALTHYDRLARTWAAENALVDKAVLSNDQRFLLIHGIRTYYGSTRLLAVGERPLWMVMEGQYAGPNTCDLISDHVFLELRNNPWVVRNLLEWYRDRYSYTDTTRSTLPGTDVHDPTPHPGGISFTHDMGSGATIFFPKGKSSYEVPEMSGVTAFMTSEELTNWTLTALLYVEQTKDTTWARANLGTFEACLASLLNRDDSDPSKRDGVTTLESSLTGVQGHEITTYDALDASLGPARRSAYLAGKQWAAYVCLAKLFAAHGRPSLAKQAWAQARLVADTMVASAKGRGYIPALLPTDGKTALNSRAIPVIEGLAYPLYAGAAEALDFDGEYGTLMHAMRTHMQTILKPGVCLYPDGAWKLSSTSDISWLTTPLLHTHVFRRVLGSSWDKAGRRCDSAFVSWCLGTAPSASNGIRGANYWCFVEQFENGKAWNSYYYARGSLAALWLEEHPSTARLTPRPTRSRRAPSLAARPTTGAASPAPDKASRLPTPGAASVAPDQASRLPTTGGGDAWAAWGTAALGASAALAKLRRSRSGVPGQT
jgi:hypothetical protein